MKIRLTGLLFFYYLMNMAQVHDFELSTDQDYFRVGDHIEVKVSLIHDESKSIYFPDKNSDYGRFELVSKSVKPSEYIYDSLVLDRATYTLRTFEVTDSLPLFLDIKLGREPEQTTKRTQVKWMHRLDGTLTNSQDELLPEHRYHSLPYQMDYRLYLAILIFLGLLVLLFLRVIVPRIYLQVKKKRFKKRHQKFMEQYPSSDNWGMQQWQSYLADWKVDVSRSVGVSLVGYSNSKLKQIFGQSGAQHVFGKLDQMFYNPKAVLELNDADFQLLKQLSEEKFSSKLEKLSR